MPKRLQPLLLLLALLGGAVLFAYAVQRAGVEELREGVRRVGWGLLVVIALGGVRFALRAQCWRLCLPAGVRLGFWHALSAFLAGDAAGSVTPLGMLASEPTKVVLVRHHLATLESVASLTIENILYSVSVLAMLAFGFTLLLATAAVPQAAWWVAGGTVLAVLGAATAAVTVLRSPGLLRLRRELRRFAADHPSRLAQVFSLQLLYHLLAVLEAYLTLQWVSATVSPTVVQAIVFETVNRFTTVVFKFVPFRVGVDEAAAGAIAPVVAVTAAAGVTLAIVRKARMLCWSAVGLLLIATHPARRAFDGKP